MNDHSDIERNEIYYGIIHDYGAIHEARGMDTVNGIVLHRANMERLAEYLANYTPPKKSWYFNMWTFFAPGECGTGACAVGHAPYALKIDHQDLPTYGHGAIDWTQFAHENLIAAENDTGYQHYQDEAWEWCFSSYWADVDDTPEGAATRIRILLDSGVPREFRGDCAEGYEVYREDAYRDA